jgi:hypothetical protein
MIARQTASRVTACVPLNGYLVTAGGGAALKAQQNTQRAPLP